MSPQVQLINPVEFLEPNRRLFIDTNIFMETDEHRAGGLKRLFERGKDTIIRNSNPIVVPTKVVSELTRQSQLNPSSEGCSRHRRQPDPNCRACGDRAEAIKKAGTALTFLESASRVGLIRKDLGDDTNPYADDLFLKLFEHFAGTYEMCLLTHDITVKLRVRVLAHRLSKRLLVGALTKDGDLEVDSDEALFERGFRKYRRHAARVAEGTGSFKDESEVASLKPLLDQFRQSYGLKELDATGGRHSKHSSRTKPAKPLHAANAGSATAPFATTKEIPAPDVQLPFTALPTEGDQVKWESGSKSGSFSLGTLLGEGGEGSVYEGSGDTVVKIFDKDHVTLHRRQKVELMVKHGLQTPGVCVPSALVRNSAGDFVGYVMPKASGYEFQRAIFNKRKFEKEFPNWRKADLVDVCISFLEKVRYLHSMNVILGDINPKNLMVDPRKNVFIIDADSWQVEGYPCPVGTPMFTSPRMLGKSYADDLRTMEDELFAVATMLFMIVMTGQFPYIRTGTDGDIAQLIKEGRFAFQVSIRGTEYNDRNQPEGDWKYMWSHIYYPVKVLFFDTFDKKHGKRYMKRPTAAEWLEAFKAYKAYLGDKQANFDPMSNEVRPIRSKAYKRETPIVDCPQCKRKDAIAGIWKDEEEYYSTPHKCNKCKESGSVRPKSTGKSAAPATAERNAKCTDCDKSVRKAQLTSGRCPACTKKAFSLDQSRLCTNCRQPFITYKHIDWFTSRGLEVPKSHAAIKETCQPVRASSTQAASESSSQGETSLWARFKKWLQGS